jgi:hypothetical protein
MMGSSASTAFSPYSKAASVGAEVGLSRHHQYSPRSNTPQSSQPYCEDSMISTRTNKTQTVITNPETVREADILSLKEWANKLSAKEGARIAGMTPSGFKKVQAGEAALSFEKLMNSMRRDPELLALIFARCGGNLNMSPNQFAAIARAVNSIVRGDHSE